MEDKTDEELYALAYEWALKRDAIVGQIQQLEPQAHQYNSQLNKVRQELGRRRSSKGEQNEDPPGPEEPVEA